MATHSSVLAWRIPGMGEPGGLPYMGSHRVGHDWSDLAAAVKKEWALITVVVQLLSCVWGLCDLMDYIARQASLSSSIFWGLLKLMSIELVMPLNHLILCHPVLLPSIFPSIRVFSNESAFPLGRQSIGASTSASVLPKINRVDFIKDWLVWSPCCPRDSQESSPALQFKRISSSVLILLYGPTDIHTWLLEKP